MASLWSKLFHRQTNAEPANAGEAASDAPVKPLKLSGDITEGEYAETDLDFAKDEPATGEGDDGLVVIAEPEPDAPEFSKFEPDTAMNKAAPATGEGDDGLVVIAEPDPGATESNKFVKFEPDTAFAKDEPATGEGDDGLVVIAEPGPDELVANKAAPDELLANKAMPEAASPEATPASGDTAFPKVEIEPSEEDAAGRVFPKVEIDLTSSYEDAAENELPAVQSPHLGEGEHDFGGVDTDEQLATTLDKASPPDHDLIARTTLFDPIQPADPLEMDFKKVPGLQPTPLQESEPPVPESPEGLGGSLYNEEPDESAEASTLLRLGVEDDMKALTEDGFDFDAASPPLEPDDDELPDLDP